MWDQKHPSTRALGLTRRITYFPCDGGFGERVHCLLDRSQKEERREASLASKWTLYDLGGRKGDLVRKEDVRS